MNEITITTTKENYTLMWLVLWQGALDLTSREREVLAAILDKILELNEEGIKEPYLSKLLFDKDTRKYYCDKLGISAFNLTNLLSGLKEKKVIKEVSKGLYEVDSKVIPQKEVTFKFDVR